MVLEVLYGTAEENLCRILAPGLAAHWDGLVITTRHFLLLRQACGGAGPSSTVRLPGAC